MASVTYGKCYLWQKYYVKCNYGKNIMANETEPSILLNTLLKWKMSHFLSKIYLKRKQEHVKNRLKKMSAKIKSKVPHAPLTL